ncbi:rRNA maturation RNase YbeY [Balneola sp. MJW-20]|uniref:rRNA maturation RNase YbeY n=1 Tax=Gracilimonas aurantiaca TaxID=3234185 RepID=UPI0034656E72
MESHSPSVIELFNTSDQKIPVNQQDLNQAAGLLASQENVSFTLVEVVYVDEDEIININQEYLDRNYVTDIISFSYHEEGDDIEGTLYCCAPRIEEQARELDEDLKKEYMRIFFHGLLHLTGYGDQTEQDKEQMTELENNYLTQSGF